MNNELDINLLLDDEEKNLEALALDANILDADENALPTPPVVTTTEPPVTEPIVPEPVIKQDEFFEKPPVSNSYYVDTVKAILGNQEEIEEEDENGVVVKLKIEDIEWTPERISEIVQQKVELERHKALENKIDATGISDFSKRIIELEKQGVNPVEILKVKQQVLDPLEGLDLTDTTDQKKAVWMHLRALKYEESHIPALIAGFEANGILEAEAEKADAALRKMIDNHIKQQEMVAQQEAEKVSNLLKEYKKEVKDNLASYDLKDTVKAKVAQALTKTTDNGRFEIDQFYFDALKDPKKATKLAIFLMDTDLYDNLTSRKAVEKEIIDEQSKLRLRRRTTEVDDYQAATTTRKQGVIDTSNL